MAQVGLYFWSIAGIKDRPFWKVWCGSSTANSFRSFFLGSAFRRSSLCLPECGTPKPLMVLITFPVVLVEASVKSRPLGSYEALIFFFPGDFSRPKGSKRPKMWSFLELRSEQHPGFRLPKCHHPDVVHRSSDREAWAGSIQQIQNDWRKFRSQNSDNMDRWKAEQGSGREKRKIRRKKTRRERVRCRCEKR